MVLLLMAETMFFCGLVSAYLVARANAAEWPPPTQPRLPVAFTAFNTAVLLASAGTLFRASRERPISRKWVLTTVALGAAFVALQGSEWVRLVGFGLTTRSSVYGAFFYLIVGAHALHAVAGLAVLAVLARKSIGAASLRLGAMYWYFVVGLWPVLYALVYLL
jgi:heme/copper-type cytochrome/quinol oxidase subunit 3